MHDLTERVQRPLQLLGVVEVLTADDAFGRVGVFSQLEHVHSQLLGQACLLVTLLLSQPSSLLFGFQGTELHRYACLDPDQKIVAEKQVVHLDVDILLHDRVPMLAQDRGQTRERQVRGGRHPLRRK